MRRSIKGAAAIAALCSGALALSPVLAAEVSGVHYYKSAADGSKYIGRVAGADRVQTSLEGVAAAGATASDTVVVVGSDGIVDALVASTIEKPVVYAEPNGLSAATLKWLEGNNSLNKIIILGGTKVATSNIEAQIAKSMAKDSGDKIEDTVEVLRVAGADRYDTALLLAGYKAGGDSKTAVTKAAEVAAAVAAFDKALADFNQANTAYKMAKAEAKAAARAYAEAMKAATEKAPAGISDSALAALREIAQNYSYNLAKYLEADSMLTAALDANNNDRTVTLEDAQVDVARVNELLGSTLLSGSSTLNDFENDVKTFYSDNHLGVPQVEAYAELFKGEDSAAARAKAEAMFRPYAEAVVTTKAAAEKAEAAKNEAKKALNKAWMKLQAVVGGSNAAPTQVVADDMYDDAIEASITALSARTEDLVLATGDNFADSLTAGPLAHKLDAPLLLTQAGVLNGNVARVIMNTNFDEDKGVYAVGGPAAAAYTKAYKKLVGADRYETSVKVALELDKPAASNFALASGEGSGADAVVAGSVLSQISDGAAILLTQSNSLPASVATYLSYGDSASANQKPVDKLLVFGGSKVVSDSVLDTAWNALTR